MYIISEYKMKTSKFNIPSIPVPSIPQNLEMNFYSLGFIFWDTHKHIHITVGLVFLFMQNGALQTLFSLDY